jgi:hypothetical protein
MIALTSATGKLGSAVLNAILDNKLIDPKELVVCVSQHSTDISRYFYLKMRHNILADILSIDLIRSERQ